MKHKNFTAHVPTQNNVNNRSPTFIFIIFTGKNCALQCTSCRKTRQVIPCMHSAVLWLFLWLSNAGINISRMWLAQYEHTIIWHTNTKIESFVCTGHYSVVSYILYFTFTAKCVGLFMYKHVHFPFVRRQVWSVNGTRGFSLENVNIGVQWIVYQSQTT